jgi:tetratricopeptide (TPR) repeat protein
MNRIPTKSTKASDMTPDIQARIFSRLGLIQITTLVALIGLVLSLAIYLHHETDDYFIPIETYLQSLKIALPPAVIFGTTYIIAFVTGTPISDTPKAVLGFVRNRFLQSYLMMWVTIAFVIAFGAYTAWTIAWRTPPAYESFVSLLLSGSSDNLALARDRVMTIRKDNPKLATNFMKVIEVFSERAAVNAGTRTLSGDRARTFVRSLEADAAGPWGEHPLRHHALAEAYLLFGQGVDRASGAAGSALIPKAASPYRRAIELYQTVAADRGPFASKGLRLSALNNVGNAYYYLGDSERALAAWRQTNSADAGQPNLSSWGNIVAALVILDRPKEAIDEGDRARAWAELTGKALVETYPFAGILGNTGFARMQVGDYVGALGDFATAHAFREDDLTRQNLALALIVVDRPADAQRVLRQIIPPLGPGEGTLAIKEGKVAACVYLIWALAMPDSPIATRAANFSAFLGEKNSSQQLSSMTRPVFSDLLRRVESGLDESDFPCRSLSKIQAIRDLLHPA